MHELQVVSGSVVLRELAVTRPHQAADRQIETGGTVLPLIVAIREEIDDLVCQPRLPQDVWHGAIDHRITAPAPFVGKGPGITHRGQH